MIRRRTLILLGILVLSLLASVVYLAASIRLPGPRHASAPTLTPAHLRTIESALKISFPPGSTLQHATLVRGKDSVFFALINAPANTLDTWPGPPTPPFRLQPREQLTQPYLNLPWAPRSIPAIRAQWSDEDGTGLWITEPDAKDTALVFLWRGGDRKKFPQSLYSLFPSN